MPLRTDQDYQRIENREAVRLKLRQIARRVGDAAVFHLDRQFEDALSRGDVLRVGYSDKELERLVRQSAERLLPASEPESVR